MRLVSSAAISGPSGFDKTLADLFDMEDEIIADLASQLRAELVANEARRAERTPRPDSTDLYFQGMAWLNKVQSSENLAQARGFFERAVALDPDNLAALIGTASVDALVAGSYMADKAPSTTFDAATAVSAMDSRRQGINMNREVLFL